MPRQINQAGLDLIKEFEGCKLSAYQDQAGIWTIGYGSTTDVDESLVISQSEANTRLLNDLHLTEASVTEAVKVPLNDNQFSALVSLAYNIGIGHLLHHTLLSLVNQGKFEAAAEHFVLYNKTGGMVSEGLTRRRLAEKALFLS